MKKLPPSSALMAPGMCLRFFREEICEVLLRVATRSHVFPPPQIHNMSSEKGPF